MDENDDKKTGDINQKKQKKSRNTPSKVIVIVLIALTVIALFSLAFCKPKENTPKSVLSAEATTLPPTRVPMTFEPTSEPTLKPTIEPTEEPTEEPTPKPTPYPLLYSDNKVEIRFVGVKSDDPDKIVFWATNKTNLIMYVGATSLSLDGIEQYAISARLTGRISPQSSGIVDASMYEGVENKNPQKATGIFEISFYDGDKLKEEYDFKFINKKI